METFVGVTHRPDQSALQIAQAVKEVHYLAVFTQGQGINGKVPAL